MNMKQAIDFRSKCGHFRILIIGRRNAGKTTLLKRVCNSVDDPEIFTPRGKKRGLHDIENELIFKSNPQFIFHDSRGLEAGSDDEMKKIKTFIEERAASSELSDQLHAVWYCMPTDTNRPILDADEQFFNTSGTGKVPVIAIFTKFDGLVATAFQQLHGGGKSLKEARTGKTELAQTMLTRDFLDRLKNLRFPPSEYVKLDDMRCEASSCVELIDKTANALNDDNIRLLFVSVQQNNIDLCINWAVRG
ncbi:hypothetical protein B0H13DRAFT_2226253 [Mycena leptocephala]|nr:hypothetical protein B0H13DRAFT_2226253 [Mycena leptocephala]